MVSTLIAMTKWSEQIEEELALLIKDWLKAQGRTQADLQKSLKAFSMRMPALLEVLKKEYKQGGLPNVASLLCKVEENWSTHKQTEENEGTHLLNRPKDPFDQLDLLIEEIREDCDS